jgi:hypothetical protein
MNHSYERKNGRVEIRRSEIGVFGALDDRWADAASFAGPVPESVEKKRGVRSVHMGLHVDQAGNPSSPFQRQVAVPIARRRTAGVDHTKDLGATARPEQNSPAADLRNQTSLYAVADFQRGANVPQTPVKLLGCDIPSHSLPEFPNETTG